MRTQRDLGLKTQDSTLLPSLAGEPDHAGPDLESVGAPCLRHLAALAGGSNAISCGPFLKPTPSLDRLSMMVDSVAPSAC